ncbi:hypothetical protein Godav_019222 [Gossypium davidsonii]|uniref:DUF7745 domain-containing protein n=2 Tax=Gossypium TaxID=3633 RepID=A0A7J8QZU9_GOSDV|nr:hypothetical protein [Gossypium davidsonii]MBA0641754.1 hypothetical protein [Gossypium klotzschianum]
MEREFLGKVEDNAAVRVWSEKVQQEKGDSLVEGDERAIGCSLDQEKGDNKCIPWKNLQDLILAHPDMKKGVDIFALSIYGLVIFPKALGHVDEAVLDLFDRLDKRVTLVPVILAETFRSLNACRRAGEGRRDNYRKKVREISNAWNQTRRMKILTVNPMITPEYSWWWERRINDNIPVSSQEDVRQKSIYK